MLLITTPPAPPVTAYTRYLAEGATSAFFDTQIALLNPGTDTASVPRTLGPIPASAQVGVIAGNRSLNPLFSAGLTGPDDGKVTVASTHLAGETDHVTLPQSHTWLMWRRPVLDQVKNFLKTGRFLPAATA